MGESVFFFSFLVPGRLAQLRSKFSTPTFITKGGFAHRLFVYAGFPRGPLIICNSSLTIMRRHISTEPMKIAVVKDDASTRKYERSLGPVREQPSVYKLFINTREV